MPFMVLFAVPLALFGAFLGALRARPADGRLFRSVFVMLNWPFPLKRILIVSSPKRRRQEGLTIVDAAMEAARLRLRPILMTAFAFLAERPISMTKPI